MEYYGSAHRRRGVEPIYLLSSGPDSLICSFRSSSYLSLLPSRLASCYFQGVLPSKFVEGVVGKGIWQFATGSALLLLCRGVRALWNSKL